MSHPGSLGGIINMMTKSVENLSIPEDLIVADSSGLLDKLSRFAIDGAMGLHAVLDFDRTLTVKRPNTNDEVTTWHILREYLPDSAKTEYQSLFNTYRVREFSGTMTQEEAIEWWSATLNLFVEHNINLNDVEATFLERASIRPGTEELFELFESSAIPSTILSAGIHDVIDIWTRKYKINPTLTLSTKLQTDPEGVISGWHQDTLVHVLNKSEVGHEDLEAIRNERPNTLVIGDSMDDATMAKGDDRVLRIRLLDQRDDDNNQDHEIERTFERFDALITTGTMHPISELVKTIVRSS